MPQERRALSTGLAAADRISVASGATAAGSRAARATSAVLPPPSVVTVDVDSDRIDFRGRQGAAEPEILLQLCFHSAIHFHHFCYPLPPPDKPCSEDRFDQLSLVNRFPNVGGGFLQGHFPPKDALVLLRLAE